MTNPNENLDCSDMNAAIDQEISNKIRQWLGEDGISFFREIKEKYGRVDACFVERTEDGSPGIPHPVHFREGMQVRNFLRTIFGDSWTAHDYDNRWANLVEEAIAT